MAERIVPFAMQFQEKIPDAEIVQRRGKYNGETQTWQWPEDPRDPSMVMSSPGTERPPTLCNLTTWVGDRVMLDPVIDD